VTAARRSVLAPAVAGLLLALTACAQAEPASAPPTAPATSSTSETASPGTTSEPGTAARTLEITVTGGAVQPPPTQVDLAVGETLTLLVTSDRDSVLHAHGFEVETPVPAGRPTSVQLTGTAPGVYEVELHDPDVLLLQVAVR
jgi:hypothetical protein